MDVRLRQLERSYQQGMLGKEEILRLRRLYVSNFGFCPSGFVIQQIKDHIQEYLTLIWHNHHDTRETMFSLLADYASVGDPTIAQVLKEESLFWLEISSRLGEKDVNEFPMIVVKMWLHIRLPINAAQHPKWEEMRTTASDWLRSMIASQLEQCGFVACVNIDPAQTRRSQIHGDDTTIITGVGYPLKHIGPSPLAAEFAKIYRIWVRSRSPYETFNTVMSVPIDTLNLKDQRAYFGDSFGDVVQVIPGSLRRWLLDGNPGGTNRGSIYNGHLVLANVPVDFFLTWSTHSERAHREVLTASEADIETLPEMIIFVDTQEKTMYLVPTPTEYFKECYYLRLVASA